MGFINLKFKVTIKEIEDDVDNSKAFIGDKYLGIIDNEDLIDQVFEDRDLEYRWHQGEESFNLTPDQLTTLQLFCKPDKK